MARNIVHVFSVLMLLASSPLLRADELPLCAVQFREDEAISSADIQKLHNCRTRRFPITLENGFTNDLGHYTGTWKNGKRDGEGTTTNWISIGMTSRWENDRPSNGLASYGGCTSRTHGYIYNGRFLSFTLPIDWLAAVSRDWGLTWLAEVLFGTAGLTQSLLSVVLD
jgi:hypothetical protein